MKKESWTITFLMVMIKKYFSYYKTFKLYILHKTLCIKLDFILIDFLKLRLLVKIHHFCLILTNYLTPKKLEWVFKSRNIYNFIKLQACIIYLEIHFASL